MAIKQIMKMLTGLLIVGILGLSGFMTTGWGDENSNKVSAAGDFFPADKPGPYNVGASSFAFSYGDDRKLPVVVWYPTKDKTGKQMTYLSRALTDPKALKNAKVAPCGPFPLIVFSHGHQAINVQSFTFIDHLVSHGYVVAACNHQQNTAFTSFTPTYFAKSAIDRPQDMSALIDAMLAKNNDSADRLHGKLDPDRIGIFGHSFGGYTTIAALGAPIDIKGMTDKCDQIGQENWSGEWKFCNDLAASDRSYADQCHPCNLGDPRIKVAVPMAPAFPYLVRIAGLAKIDVPVLIMAGELDEITPPRTQNRLYFDGLTHSETLYWELAKASHYTFSSGCEIPVIKRFFPCGTDRIDQDRATPLIQTALTAYFGLHLQGDERYRYYFKKEYLDTAPEITLETKKAVGINPTTGTQ